MNQAEKDVHHQISPESDPSQGEYRHHLEFAIMLLKKEYGIDDLSSYEKEQLEKLVTQCLLEFKQQREWERKGEMSEQNIPRVCVEAVTRWLFELYGIRPSEVHRELTVYASPHDVSKGISDVRKYEIPPGHLQEAEKKAADLRAEGNLTVVIVPGKVDEKFKQYLQILRKRGAIGEDKL